MLKSMISMVLSLLFAASPALGADAPAGEIKALIPAASKNAQPVNVHDSLAWNDLLHTDAKGRLRAGLTDGSILSLGSNSELKVVQHDSASQQTSIEMNYGKLRNQVVKITQPNGKYEVKTPNAVIGVIGTDFYVGFGNNQTTVICYTGVVTVTPSGGAKVVKSDSGNNGSTNSVHLLAGQMVVIGMEIPPAGYQPSTAPPEISRQSMTDTSVSDGEPVVAKAGSHLVRNVILGVGVAAAGWAVAITELRTGTPAAPPPPVTGCGPNDPKCR